LKEIPYQTLQTRPSISLLGREQRRSKNQRKKRKRKRKIIEQEEADLAIDPFPLPSWASP
jgi:hypothetical protein